MRPLLFTLALLTLSAAAQAQVYTTSYKMLWSAPSNAMDVADAQQAIYKLYVDGKPWGDLSPVTCRLPDPGDTVATCEIRLTDALLAVVNKRKTALSLTVRDPEPDAVEIGPGPALVLKRPFVIAKAVTIAP